MRAKVSGCAASGGVTWISRSGAVDRWVEMANTWAIGMARTVGFIPSDCRVTWRKLAISWLRGSLESYPMSTALVGRLLTMSFSTDGSYFTTDVVDDAGSSFGG